MMAVTVSGSFHRHMTDISDAVEMLHDAGIRVLSPADPRVVDAIGPFLFVASDRHRSVRLVQDRHLASIQHSDFIWLVCHDGYVGQSVAMEVGFAVARGIPIYCQDWPHDLTLRHYVNKVDSIAEAIRLVAENRNRPRRDAGPSLLIDSTSAVEAAHESLGRLQGLLSPAPCVVTAGNGNDLAEAVAVERQIIANALDLGSDFPCRRQRH